MKILILGDIHGRLFWKEPVKKYIKKVDKIIFLGDYCDPYYDEGTEPISWEQTLNNFQEIIELKRNNPDKVVLLIGNHDEHYRNSQFSYKAKSTRYDSTHSNQLCDMFNGDNYNLFQLCYAVDNNGKKVIFTHAGITKFWLDACDLKYDENIQDAINNLEETAVGVDKLCIIGKCRTWFGEKTGSPLWCDLEEFILEKTAIGEDVYQIFGHTRLKKGVNISMTGFSCLDSQTAFILNDKNKLRTVCNEKIKTNKEHGTVQNTENDKP